MSHDRDTKVTIRVAHLPLDEFSHLVNPGLLQCKVSNVVSRATDTLLNDVLIPVYYIFRVSKVTNRATNLPLNELVTPGLLYIQSAK